MTGLYTNKVYLDSRQQTGGEGDSAYPFPRSGHGQTTGSIEPRKFQMLWSAEAGKFGREICSLQAVLVVGHEHGLAVVVFGMGSKFGECLTLMRTTL
jgi:hypothetical protein